METSQTPGSYDEFREHTGLAEPELLKAYELALDAFRIAVGGVQAKRKRSC